MTGLLASFVFGTCIAGMAIGLVLLGTRESRDE